VSPQPILPAHVAHEAHVEHAVGFVEDEVRDAVEPNDRSIRSTPVRPTIERRWQLEVNVRSRARERQPQPTSHSIVPAAVQSGGHTTSSFVGWHSNQRPQEASGKNDDRRARRRPLVPIFDVEVVMHPVASSIIEDVNSGS
jgi:hypothetical protein